MGLAIVGLISLFLSLTSKGQVVLEALAPQDTTWTPKMTEIKDTELQKIQGRQIKQIKEEIFCP